MRRVLPSPLSRSFLLFCFVPNLTLPVAFHLHARKLSCTRFQVAEPRILGSLKRVYDDLVSLVPGQVCVSDGRDPGNAR